MGHNSESKGRTFILENARIYLPGSLPDEAPKTATQAPASGCCGSGPEPTTGAKATGCDTQSTAAQATCC
ncbi:MAG: hypothetical protein AAF604_03515 [Acidobacteriota bacterium]